MHTCMSHVRYDETSPHKNSTGIKKAATTVFNKGAERELGLMQIELHAELILSHWVGGCVV